MIHRSSSNPHLKKGIDTIQKHKIRNLRAKLKNLLSNDSCNKYSKRQKQIKKIQSLENLQFYQTKSLFNLQKHLFTHTKQQPKQFWYSQKQKCNVMNVFGKLSKDQIQQIKQDMIYYLGQENVPKFKQFLTIKENIRLQKLHNKENLEKHTKRLKTQKEQEFQEGTCYQQVKNNRKGNISRRISAQNQKKSLFEKQCSQTDNNFFGRRSIQTMNQNLIDQSDPIKRLKTANLYESRTSALTRQQNQNQRQKFQANYLGNRQNFLNKRRMLQEEQNAQRLLNKVSLQMKQEKAVDIFRGNQDAFLTTIRQKNQQNDSKTKKILEDKYKKNVTFGAIVELNEQLRKIYIKKISQMPKFSQIPQSQVINDRHKYDTTLSGFFRQNHEMKLNKH